jgi:hypothetical protein
LSERLNDQSPIAGAAAQSALVSERMTLVGNVLIRLSMDLVGLIDSYVEKPRLPGGQDAECPICSRSFTGCLFAAFTCEHCVCIDCLHGMMSNAIYIRYPTFDDNRDDEEDDEGNEEDHPKDEASEAEVEEQAEPSETTEGTETDEIGVGKWSVEEIAAYTRDLCCPMCRHSDSHPSIWGDALRPLPEIVYSVLGIPKDGICPNGGCSFTGSGRELVHHSLTGCTQRRLRCPSGALTCPGIALAPRPFGQSNYKPVPAGETLNALCTEMQCAWYEHAALTEAVRDHVLKECTHSIVCCVEGCDCGQKVTFNQLLNEHARLHVPRDRFVCCSD